MAGFVGIRREQRWRMKLGTAEGFEVRIEVFLKLLISRCCGRATTKDVWCGT